MKKKYEYMFIWILIVLNIISCKEKEKGESTSGGKEKVLALVNNEKITEYDVEQAIKRTFKKEEKSENEKIDREIVLKSLVGSRAMAMQMEKELGEKEIREINKDAEIYREKILVKKYIAKHAPPEEVTEEMIKKYYEENRAKFGGEEQQIYEMIFSKESMAPKDREEFIKEVKTSEKKEDWKKWAEELREKRIRVEYRKDIYKKGLIEPGLETVVNKLRENEVSKVNYINGRAYLMRVTEIRRKEAKPLDEVREKIRKTLRPIKLKEAVKRVSEDILKKTKVVYK